MINVNGHRFMTLNDPIYINGRRVREVYANGKLVYPSMPAYMTITKPPDKTAYEYGEEIDYTGIEATLYNSDGSVWASIDYPGGKIPFEELIFPEPVAARDGIWPDGGIIHTTEDINCAAYYMNTPISKDYRSRYYSDDLWVKYYDTPGTSGGARKCMSSAYSGALYFATVYNGWLYIYRMSDGDRDNIMWVWLNSIWWDYLGYIETGKWYKTVELDYYEAHANFPISDVDPLGTSSFNFNNILVPIKWRNIYNSEYLEAYTAIQISKND